MGHCTGIENQEQADECSLSRPPYFWTCYGLQCCRLNLRSWDFYLSRPINFSVLHFMAESSDQRESKKAPASIKLSACSSGGTEPRQLVPKIASFSSRDQASQQGRVRRRCPLCMRYIGKEIWGEREEQLSTGVSGFVSKEDASSSTIHSDQNMLCSPASCAEPTNLEGGAGRVASLK